MCSMLLRRIPIVCILHNIELYTVAPTRGNRSLLDVHLIRFASEEAHFARVAKPPRNGRHFSILVRWLVDWFATDYPLAIPRDHNRRGVDKVLCRALDLKATATLSMLGVAVTRSTIFVSPATGPG